MNQTEAESVKDLAKLCNDVLEKLGWKWKPELGEWFLSGNELILLPQETDCVRWECTEQNSNSYLVIQYSDGQSLVAEYNFPLTKCTPILPWEEIERVLEGTIYRLLIHKYENQVNCLIYKGKVEFMAKAKAKSRQRAVMQSVIQLGKEIDAKGK